MQRNGTPFDYAHGLRATAAVDAKAASALFDGSSPSLDELLAEADKPGRGRTAIALKTSAELRVSTTTRRYSSPDVVGVIEGADPTLKNEYVALMAHADQHRHQPHGFRRPHQQRRTRQCGGYRHTAGGGASVRVHVTAAAALHHARRQHRRGKGLLGAEYFAHNTPVPAERIVAAIDLDMPVLLYDFTDVVAYGASHSTLDAAFRAAGSAMNVAVSPDPMPEQSIFVRSDHYAMARSKKPRSCWQPAW